MRSFPVIWPYDRITIHAWEVAGCPRLVPWDLLAPHEAQARINHGGQSLERLAERGGLSPCEIAAVIGDRRWSMMPDAEAIAIVVAAVQDTVRTP